MLQASVARWAKVCLVSCARALRSWQQAALPGIWVEPFERLLTHKGK
jgi:hypothetical protein